MLTTPIVKHVFKLLQNVRESAQMLFFMVSYIKWDYLPILKIAKQSETGEQVEIRSSR